MKYQFMPMFWGDFLANTMHLSAQEAGAYLFLIAHAWEHDGCVPCGYAQRIARVNNYHWAKVRAALEPFFEVRGGTSEVVPPWYYHARVHQELTSAAELSNKRKEAGKAGAQQMLGKRSANVPPSILQLPIEKLSNGKGSKAPKVQVQVNYRDPGVEYRNPPRKKSDNELKPLPDKFKA